MPSSRRCAPPVLLVLGFLCFAAGPPAIATSQGSGPPARVRLGYPGGRTLSPAERSAFRAALARPLVRDPVAYRAAKAAADARASALAPSASLRGPAIVSRVSGVRSGSTTGPSRDRDAPSAAAASSATRPSVSSWEGLKDATNTPSDSTGAIGPNSYVEMVNVKIAVYSRAHLLLMSDNLANLTGGNPFLTDPQIIWDPDTNRFYYVILDASVAYGFNDGIDFEFGFSRTDSPTSLSDWCNFEVDAGYDDGVSSTLLPDQPHLGDSQNFLFWGVNTFDLGMSPPDDYVGSDAIWISKPPSGSSCPADISSFTQGKQANLLNADSSQTLTPVGVNQTDSDPNGWMIGSEDPTVGTANALTLFQVTDNGDGTASVQPTGSPVPVPTFEVPANAVQGGVAGHLLDTMDGRLTQAVSAIDPSRSGSLAIWTQHTVFGGGGAAVRWYEIDPIAPAVFQQGTISSRNLFVFNAAISPDREVSGSSASFGNSMGIGFTSTSFYTDSTLWAASKVGNAPLSPWVLVKQSPGPEIDQSCSPCRWGDYMGATPDPGADPVGVHGAVWMTSMWNAKSTGSSNFDWRTQNWRMGIVPNSSSCTQVGTVAADFLTGSSGHDVLCGLGGNDVLLAGGGNDTLLGAGGIDLLLPEGGNDTVKGGPGTDYVDYETLRPSVTVNLAKRVATGQGTDKLLGIEFAIGSSRDDLLIGSRSANQLYGLGGADRLFGGGGGDYLNGGPGNDYLDGQAGRDTCVSGGGVDTKVSCER